MTQGQKSYYYYDRCKKSLLIKPMSLHGKSLEETKNGRDIAQHNKVYAAKLC